MRVRRYRQLDLFTDSPPPDAAAWRGRASSDTAPSPSQAPDPAPPNPELPAEPLQAFLATLEAAGRSRHTVKSVQLDILQLARFLAPRPLSSVTARDLRHVVPHLAIDRRNKSSSLRRKIASYKAFGRFLEQAGLVTQNPASRLRYPHPVALAPRTLSDEECERLLSAARSHSPLWYTLVLTLLETGLKRDEILALRPTDVNLSQAPHAGGILHLRRRRDAQRTRLRALPISPALAPALGAWLSQVAEHSPRLFPLSPRGVDYIVEQCGRRAGIRSTRIVTPRVLRDTFATRRAAEFVRHERLLLDSGASPEEIARVKAGHDRSLLQQLGLSLTSDAVERYRRAADPHSDPERSTR